jgi:multidrug efflux pump subunit AcrA (membrane-fusion protein)
MITRRLVRRGSIAAAGQLLAWLESSVTEDLRVAVARARLLEWRQRDPLQALRVVESAQQRMPEQAAELELRRTRLKKKLELSSGRSHRRGKRDVWQVQLEAPILDSPA